MAVEEVEKLYVTKIDLLNPNKSMVDPSHSVQGLIFQGTVERRGTSAIEARWTECHHSAKEKVAMVSLLEPSVGSIQYAVGH